MKEIILTWIKPTSDNLHIWNYFWSIKYMLDFQSSWDYETMLFIANMHTLTTLHDAEKIRANSINSVRTYLSCWIDPKKTIIYNPAKIAAHAQLSWILSCLTNIWFMKRMHAYKDAIAKNNEENTTVWTFSYPILMAADILLYEPDLVPVWKDQKQHVEFARDIAWKFNNNYWNTFKLPQPHINSNVAVIPWIDWRKMSKSYNNFIWLFDDKDTLLKKIRSIPTMSKWIDEKKNPDECNVYNMLRMFLDNDENLRVREWYEKWWLSFKEVKDTLLEKVTLFLLPIQEKSKSISDDYVISVINEWTNRANKIAERKIDEVYSKIGFNL